MSMTNLTQPSFTMQMWISKRELNESDPNIVHRSGCRKVSMTNQTQPAQMWISKGEFVELSLDLENIQHEKKSVVYINMSTVNQGQAQVQVELVIIEISWKLH